MDSVVWYKEIPDECPHCLCKTCMCKCSEFECGCDKCGWRGMLDVLEVKISLDELDKARDLDSYKMRVCDCGVEFKPNRNKKRCDACVEKVRQDEILLKEKRRRERRLTIPELRERDREIESLLGKMTRRDIAVKFNISTSNMSKTIERINRKREGEVGSCGKASKRV